MLVFPEIYVEDKFFKHVGFPQKKINGDMVGCCPICMEGKSWGKKKRFNYFSDKQAWVCFNCGSTFNTISFIKTMEGCTYGDIIKEVGDDDFIDLSSGREYVQVAEEKKEIDKPTDTIDLFDEGQRDFYEDDYFVTKAWNEIRRRRLDRAVNRGELWLSPKHWLHKNRIIIPFRDVDRNLLFYQSRAQTSKQEEMGKYISSLNGCKIFYGLDKLDYSSEYSFMFEGPLDCFFVRNSFGGGGLKLNSDQKDVLADIEMFTKLVYCLDNDFDNSDVVDQYRTYISEGKRVFMWGGEFEEVKDINQYAIDMGVNEITHDQLLDHVYSGAEAADMLESKLADIKRNRTFSDPFAI